MRLVNPARVDYAVSRVVSSRFPEQFVHRSYGSSMASVEVYINGSYYPKENAKISVYDHGLLYGDGVFEGMRAYGGRVFRLRNTSTGSMNRRGASCLTFLCNRSSWSRR
jgi:hypothetical protein